MPLHFLKTTGKLENARQKKEQKNNTHKQLDNNKKNHQEQEKKKNYQKKCFTKGVKMQKKRAFVNFFHRKR